MDRDDDEAEELFGERDIYFEMDMTWACIAATAIIILLAWAFL